MAAEVFTRLMEMRSRGRHDGPFPREIPISPGNNGIKNLMSVADLVQGQDQNKDDPIVLGEMSIPGLVVR